MGERRNAVRMRVRVIILEVEHKKLEAGS